MVASYNKAKATASGGGAYYVQSMTAGEDVDDYYVSAAEPPGFWHVGAQKDGSRLSALGIEHGAQVGPETFSELVHGRHPDDGRKLTQNAGNPNRIGLHDFTYSAPKSVSLAWALAGEDMKTQVGQAQLSACRSAVDVLSAHAETRLGKAGVNVLQTPVRAALFEHGSARAAGEDGPDPQLHTHCVVLNITEHDNGTSALETKRMLSWAGVAAQTYHCDLAWSLVEKGFQIRADETTAVFEIAGISQEQIELFSQRREQIKAAVEADLIALGHSAEAASMASKSLWDRKTIETRFAKDYALSREQLESLWKARGAEVGLTAEFFDSLRQHEVVHLSQGELRTIAQEAIDKVFQTKAVATEPQLQTAVLTAMIGKCDSATATQIARDLQSEMVRTVAKNVHLFTTKEIMFAERELVTIAARAEHQSLLNLDLSVLKTLDGEQFDAALAVATDRRLVSIVEGSAGAGKTTMTRTLVDMYTDDGYKSFGLSASWNASLNLATEAGIRDGRAITGWLNSVERGDIRIDNNTLVVIDEAGQVGAIDMHRILRACEQTRAKVLLLGDTKQQGSVASGAALRVLSERIGSNRLDVIRRQHSNEERQAVKLFFDGKAKEALKVYERQGAIQICDDRASVINRLAEKFVSDRPQFEMQLAIAQDNETVALLNKEIGTRLPEAGLTGTSHLEVETIDSKYAGPSFFRVGDSVVFRLNEYDEELTNRTVGRVAALDAEARTIIIDLKDRPGVLIHVDDEQWQHRDGGLAITHAYAKTAYSAQGDTVDKAYVVDANFGRESAGVAMSRHRNSCEIFVDKEARHLDSMNRRTPDEYTPLRKYTDEMILNDVAAAWSPVRGKVSTLDYQGWSFEPGHAYSHQAQQIIVAANEQSQKLNSAQRQQVGKTESVFARLVRERAEQKQALQQPSKQQQQQRVEPKSKERVETETKKVDAEAQTMSAVSARQAAEAAARQAQEQAAQAARNAALTQR